MNWDCDDPFAPIVTARLTIRCVRPEDADALSRMMTPGISRWLANWPVPSTRSAVTERIDAERRSAADRKSLPWVLERRSNGLALGWLRIARQAFDPGAGQIGYWLGEGHHGHGYMAEALPAAIDAACRWHELSEIEATVHPGNTASITLLRRNGFEYAGRRTIMAAARGREEVCDLYRIRLPLD